MTDRLANGLRVARRPVGATPSASSCRWRRRPSPPCMACAKLGAIWVPIFSGFGADAVAARLADAGAQVLITADGSLRKGTPVADEGGRRPRPSTWPAARHDRGVATACPTSRPRWRPAATAGGTSCSPATSPAFETRAARRGASAVHRLHERDDRPAEGRRARPRRVPGEDRRGGRLPGRPASRRASCTGSPTSAGSWGRGRSSARWRSARRCPAHEGAPTHPGPDRLWDMVERHGVTTLGVSPTLIRALIPDGDGPGARARPLLAPDPRLHRRAVEPGALPWFSSEVGGGRAARSSTSRAAPRSARASCRRSPITPLKPCTLGGPALGMDVDVWGPDGDARARRARSASSSAGSRGRR